MNTLDQLVALEIDGALLDPFDPHTRAPERLTGFVEVLEAEPRVRRRGLGGDLLWSRDLEDVPWSGGYHGGRVVLRSDTHVLALDASTGDEVWRRAIPTAHILPLQAGLRLSGGGESFHVDLERGAPAPLTRPRPPRWYAEERRFMGWREVPYLYDMVEGRSVICEGGAFRVTADSHHRAGPIALDPIIGTHRPAIEGGWRPHGYILGTPRGWLASVDRPADDGRFEAGFGLFAAEDFEPLSVMPVGMTRQADGPEFLDVWLGSTPEIVSLTRELLHEDAPRVSTVVLDLVSGRALLSASSG